MTVAFAHLAYRQVSARDMGQERDLSGRHQGDPSEYGDPGEWLSWATRPIVSAKATTELRRAPDMTFMSPQNLGHLRYLRPKEGVPNA